MKRAAACVFIVFILICGISPAADLVRRNLSWSLESGNDPIVQITNQGDEGRTLTLRLLINESSYRFRSDFDVPSGENRFVRIRDVVAELVKRYSELEEVKSGILQLEYEGTDADITAHVVNLDPRSGVTSEKESGQLPRPVIKSVNPESGSPSGGTVVTVIGDNFEESTVVRFGGLPAMRTLQSRQSLIAIAPPHAAGSVTVEVRNGRKSAELEDAFKYEWDSPVLTGVDPDKGPARGGTRVLLQGRSFQPGAVVRWDGRNVGARFQNSELLSVVSPPGRSGSVTLEVVNPDGKSTALPDAFTYRGQPEIRSVNPAMGSRAGGYTVTITGSNFEPGSSVLFSGRYGQTTYINPSTLAAVVPQGDNGSVDITVSTADGETTTLQGGFLYNEPPVITSISAYPNPIIRNTTTRITVQAVDPEAGQLDYDYRIAYGPPGGTIQGEGETAMYSSPNTTGTALIQVTVYDENHSRAQGTVEIKVE